MSNANTSHNDLSKQKNNDLALGKMQTKSDYSNFVSPDSSCEELPSKDLDKFIIPKNQKQYKKKKFEKLMGKRTHEE